MSANARDRYRRRFGPSNGVSRCKTPDEFTTESARLWSTTFSPTPKALLPPAALVHREEAMEAIARSGAIVVFGCPPYVLKERLGDWSSRESSTRRHRKLGRPHAFDARCTRSGRHTGHVCLFVGVVCRPSSGSWMNQHDGEENGPNERVSLPKKKCARHK